MSERKPRASRCLVCRLGCYVICCQCPCFRKKRPEPIERVGRNILIVGLDNAGKSGILQHLSAEGSTGEVRRACMVQCEVVLTVSCCARVPPLLVPLLLLVPLWLRVPLVHYAS